METLFSNLFSPEPKPKPYSEALAFLQCSKKHHPDLLFIKLFFLLRCAASPLTRAHSARTLHLLRPPDIWPKLKPVAQASLKAHFSAYLKQETSLPVLRLVARVLAEILSVIYNDHHQHHWPDILDFLVSFTASNDDKSRETALLVFANLLKDCRLRLSDALRGALPVLRASFMESLASSNADIQVAAFGAVVSLVRLFSDPSVFHELLRAMMVAAFALLHGSQETNFRRAFVHMVRLVTEEPALLKPYASDMLQDVLQIVESNAGLSMKTQQAAFELVMAMAEVEDYATVLKSHNHQTLVRVFMIPMKMLLLVEDEDDKKEKDGCDDVYKVGLKWLNRLCLTVGGERVMSVGFDILSLYLDSPDWKKRHAGIALLTVLSKDFSDEMVMRENFQVEVVTKFLKSLQDSHDGVRLAAFHFMQTPTNFVQAMHLLYHHRLMHAFASALDTTQNYKIKEQTASAMLFFLKTTLPDSLTLNKNADAIIKKLFSILRVHENSKSKKNGKAIIIEIEEIVKGETKLRRRPIDGKEGDKLRSIALLILNMVAQKCHELAHKYCASYLPILLEGCRDNNSEIKQEATRGIRICAELGTSHFKPFVNRILSDLSVLIKELNRSLSENAKAYDIAVSCLGRICEFHRDTVDGSKIVPAWLSCLPLQNDLIEAKLMHEQLCLMVARQDKDLLGAGNQNFIKIIVVFLEVIDKGDKLASSQTVTQINKLLRQLGRNIPRTAIDLVLSSLNDQQRELLLPFLAS
ncbi:hypothetical protein PIB30_070522 [Stylosanthes scabra]|uniref:IPO4/5-like TPR repeats domain-containing protein n=1 Tax=Stylosanthes scabra TaxID=79078 RepID=A0ABU6QNJ2_9FABA|nr:hypothetical protein [Stylosanthes scabra]